MLLSGKGQVSGVQENKEARDTMNTMDTCQGHWELLKGTGENTEA